MAIAKKIKKRKSEEHKAKISATIIGRNVYQFSVLDLNTGITKIYDGYAKTAEALGVKIGVVRTYENRQYKHYMTFLFFFVI